MKVLYVDGMSGMVSAFLEVIFYVHAIQLTNRAMVFTFFVLAIDLSVFALWLNKEFKVSGWVRS